MTLDQTLSSRRAVDWYELFFDLVFVVVIAISAHNLEHSPSLISVVLFALLLFPLWWAWVNLMLTNNLYGQNYPAFGALMIAAMPGPAAMAIAISGGIESNGWLYALGAVWIRLVLLVMWLVPQVKRTTSVPLWRPLAYNLGTALVWLISIPVPAPYRYTIWVLAVVAEMVLLAVRSGFASEVYELASVSHSLERVGLFVVIVIGEAVYLAVTGLADHPTGGGAGAALAGFVVCALLARAFFRWGVPGTEAGLAAAQRARSYSALRDVIMYLPFLLIVGLTLVAASVGVAVTEAGAPLETGARGLLAAGVAVFYLANAIVGLRLGRRLSRIVALVVPGVLLPALASWLSGGLDGWVTLALVAGSLVVLDLLSKVLGFKSARESAPSQVTV
ncbi:MAG: low temperature requirement protein A [Terrimesophilobacter sp.]